MKISVKIIQDSICESTNTRLTTFEVEYPRFIHSELMTHRMLSKNCASSRAIPIEKMHENIRSNTASPVFWGKNKSGMQAAEEVDNIPAAQIKWLEARDELIRISKELMDLGLHKQIANRVTEPVQMMKTVISGTEWNNFFWLRNHEDAQPEFRELAKQMQEAYAYHVPFTCTKDTYHVPYVDREYNQYGELIYSSTGNMLTPKEAIAVSASCCAQVSYRNNDTTLEKANKIFQMLIKPNGGPIHASPLEHQAKPMWLNASLYDPGVTHMRKDGSLWSGNFKNWVQYRQTLEGHTKW